MDTIGGRNTYFLPRIGLHLEWQLHLVTARSLEVIVSLIGQFDRGFVRCSHHNIVDQGQTFYEVLRGGVGGEGPNGGVVEVLITN